MHKGLMIALVFAGLGVLSVVLVIQYSGAQASVVNSLCVGNHNFVLNYDELPTFFTPAFDPNGTAIFPEEIKFMQLPEDGGFNQLHRDFEVTEIRVIARCPEDPIYNSTTSCEIFINNQSCVNLSYQGTNFDIGGFFSSYELTCLDAVENGFNTIEIRAQNTTNQDIRSVHFESRMRSPFCLSINNIPAAHD